MNFVWNWSVDFDKRQEITRRTMASRYLNRKINEDLKERKFIKEL